MQYHFFIRFLRQTCLLIGITGLVSADMQGNRLASVTPKVAAVGSCFLKTFSGVPALSFASLSKRGNRLFTFVRKHRTECGIALGGSSLLLGAGFVLLKDEGKKRSFHNVQQKIQQEKKTTVAEDKELRKKLLKDKAPQNIQDEYNVVQKNVHQRLLAIDELLLVPESRPPHPRCSYNSYQNSQHYNFFKQESDFLYAVDDFMKSGDSKSFLNLVVRADFEQKPSVSLLDLIDQWTLEVERLGKLVIAESTLNPETRRGRLEILVAQRIEWCERVKEIMYNVFPSQIPHDFRPGVSCKPDRFFRIMKEFLDAKA